MRRCGCRSPAQSLPAAPRQRGNPPTRPLSRPAVVHISIMSAISHPSSAPNSSATSATLPASSTRSNPTHGSIPAPPDIESKIQRMSEHKNVRGVIIMNEDGVVIRSAGGILQGSDGLVVLRRYASEARKMVEAVGNSVSGMELDDQLRFLRIRTRQHELLITPTSKFTLVVIQDPTK
ncbi:hypothetical protein O181_026937 [Austropuccinia psidii MF-1]|uniref:Roadblock/LAMTOR2 domain-containing protein n=1 Tax=Austropuccinia psidii MF-1 TaxID=1389203 RepID=A0A9Q3CP10_9BASI|nr:hypothetical protein [Austropuccinia psidii MF-1]